jgi:HEAT repeat protein
MPPLRSLALSLVLAASAPGQEVSPIREIEEGLAEESEAARRLAVRRIPGLKPEERERLLQAALADPSPRVRVEALEILFDQDPEAAARRWRKTISGEAPPFRRAFHARLRSSPTGIAIPLLIAGLSDPASRVRQEAGRSLRAATGLDLGFRATDDLESRRESVARWSAWWNQNVGRSPTDWRREALSDPTPGNRLAAIEALADERSDGSIDLLLEALVDPASTVRLRARDALRRRTLQEFGLDPLASPESTESVRRAWHDWWATHRSLDRSTRLRLALAHPHPRSRGRAAHRLSLSDDPSSIDLLLPLLDDRSSRVRERARDGLRRLSGLAFGFVPEDEKSERASARDRWKTWWRLHRNDSRRQWLLAALIDNDPSQRARAVRALGDSDDPSVFSDLLVLLDDPAGGVRQRAASALERLSGESLDFDPDADPPDRQRRREAIERWWVERPDREW